MQTSQKLLDALKVPPQKRKFDQLSHPQNPLENIAQESLKVYCAWKHEYEYSLKNNKPFQFNKIYDAGDAWENIRYQIEKKEGLQQKGSDSFLEGYLKDSDIIIPPKYHLMGDEKICLKRCVLPPGMKPFIPVKYRIQEPIVVSQIQETKIEMDENMDEQSKMDALCNTTFIPVDHQKPERKKYVFCKNTDGTISKLGKINERANYVHASDFMNGYISQREVPPNFKCRRCFVIGKHWEDACPSWEDPTLQVNKMGRRKMPHGIMMYRLRRALPHEEQDAYEKADGSLWVYKDETDKK